MTKKYTKGTISKWGAFAVVFFFLFAWLLLTSEHNSACRRSGAALAIAADGPLKCIKIRRFNGPPPNIRRASRSSCTKKSLQARVGDEFAILTSSFIFRSIPCPGGVGGAPRFGRALGRGISARTTRCNGSTATSRGHHAGATRRPLDHSCTVFPLGMYSSFLRTYILQPLVNRCLV